MIRALLALFAPAAGRDSVVLVARRHREAADRLDAALRETLDR